MSPNVGNFVHDLVEMAKAMETLPQVQDQLDRANTQIEQYAKQVQDREIAIIGYKQDIEELQAKVRTVEAERDDAEIRFLEADDRMLKLERTFQKSLEAADEVDKLIQSFKPVPPQPEPVVEVQPQGSSEAPPTTNVNNGEEKSEQTSVTSSATGDVTLGASSPTQPPASQDQSEALPTVVETQNSVISPASNSDVGSTSTETSGAEPTPGPYTNKLYHDHPVYVHPHDWIAGGGTEENYRWHPDVA